MKPDPPRFIRALIVEDDPVSSKLLKWALSGAKDGSFEADARSSLKAAFRILDMRPFDVILLDLNLSGSKGIETLSKVVKRCPGMPVVVITGEYGEDIGLEAIARGAGDYLIKGRYDMHMLRKSIHFAIERKRSEKAVCEQNRMLEQKNIALREMVEQIAMEKVRIKETGAANIENIIMPIVGRLRVRGESRKYVELLRKNLRELFSSPAPPPGRGWRRPYAQRGRDMQYG